ncbi:MAG: serine--tRNA ligase [Firmicutes bacterium]|nr:serine--tRNA ligase [Bacillota bacterium]
MLDIKFIAENEELVKQALSTRSGQYDVDTVTALYARRNQLLKQVEQLKATRNKVSDQIAALKRAKTPCEQLIVQMKDVGEEIKAFDNELADLEPKLKEAVLSIPNIPDESVPCGKDETHNKEIRRIGTPRDFGSGFVPRPHWEIGDDLKILDSATAAKITGARFTVYRGAGAKLERALVNFMLDLHGGAGYTEILPPFMVNRDSMTGTGQLPKFEQDAFVVGGTNYFLIPTAEVPVTNLLRGDVLPAADLPVNYCAYTPCFRAEAGAAGRDTRGLIRQHQFNKVELVKFCRPENSMDELESLTLQAESVLKKLELPYRVVLLCSGDLGFSSAKTYDIEVWMPSYGRYVEISSCSNFKDYQARRMNIKFKDAAGTGAAGTAGAAFLHTLNGSGLAVGRTVAAILENFQNSRGGVDIPSALVPYFGAERI